MNLYFVKAETKGMSFDDFVVLAPNKTEAENTVVRKLKRNIIKEKTRLVPNGQYLVSETFLNSES